MATDQVVKARLFRRGGLIFLVGVVAWIACACGLEESSVDSIKHTQQMESNEQTMVSVHIGRFVTEQPEWLEWKGGGHSTRHVMINAQDPWPEGTDPAQAFEDRWDLTITSLQEREFKGTADIEQMVIEQREVRPGLRAVLYHRGSSPKERMWYAILQTPESGISFQKNSWEGEVEADFEVLKEVAEAYRPKTEGGDTSSGFHTREGVVDLPFQEYEKVNARYGGKDVEISYALRTLRKSPESDLWERSLQKAARMLNLSLRTVRSRNRSVADLEGKEEVVEYEDEGQQIVTFSWRYPGKERSGRCPYIEIQLHAPAEVLDYTLPVWDHILDSFRPLEEADFG